LILVSACLCGVRCRYDAERLPIPEEIEKLRRRGECLVPVCPEQLGGLPTPRPKNHLEWNGGRPTVVTEEGEDVTDRFLQGAQETLRIARMLGVERAVLKARSPSCGEQGVTTRILAEEGIPTEIVD